MIAALAAGGLDLLAGEREVRGRVVRVAPVLDGDGEPGVVITHSGDQITLDVANMTLDVHVDEAELARRLSDMDSLRAEPEIARFLDWVSGKPGDFHAPTRRSRRKNGPHRGRRA